MAPAGGRSGATSEGWSTGLQTFHPMTTAKKRLMTGVTAAVAAVVVCWFLPPFRVVPLEVAQEQSARGAFRAAEFVEAFWHERLLTSVDRAVDVAALLEALDEDPAAARGRYGRTLGLSTTAYFFVSGVGRVVEVQRSAVVLALDEEATSPAVIIGTGPLFGNAVRDGSGLLDVSDFPNSQDFNAVSSEINRRIEEDVLPVLREEAAVGARVRFVGCVELAEATRDPRPLRVVPIVAEIL